MSTLMNCPLIAVAITIVSLSTLSISSHAYTFDLLHGDFSPRSPSYDPTLTHTQRVARALSQGSSNNAAATDISTNTANSLYIMDYSIGTPPVQVSGSLSAGSDLIWLTCKTSAFDLTRSKTYSRILCNTTRCNSLPATTCSNNTCQYSMEYERGSSTSGDFSTDTITFGHEHDSFPNISFGCGISNGISAGGIGLGKGSSSLVKQMGATKFSYCLASIASGGNGGGKLNFGESAVVGGAGTVSTPLITGSSPSFYYAHLESMKIGNDQMKVDFNEDILLELGSTVTMLHHDQYWGLIDALNASIPLNETVVNKDFTLCYSSMSNFPSIKLQFKGGVVAWKPEHVFARTGDKEWCTVLGIAEPGADAIYGSFAQADFFMGFDLIDNTVNFTPANCSA